MTLPKIYVLIKRENGKSFIRRIDTIWYSLPIHDYMDVPDDYIDYKYLTEDEIKIIRKKRA